MKKTGLQYCSLIIGILAAIAIVVSQSVSLSSKSIKSSNVEAKAVAGESSSNEQNTTFTIATTSFPTFSAVAFFQEAICLFEIFFTSDPPVSDPRGFSLPLSKFYSIIFRVIISPNAP